MLAVLLVVPLASACAGRVKAPYGVGKAPQPQELIDRTPTPLTALQVPKAKVRLRGLSATLMYAAQGPDRFKGTISVAGNELVTLGVHEQSYGLRYLSDEGLAPGYYHGPPSSCAVASLVGVALNPDELVELLLGGAPVLPGTTEVISQRWDKKHGNEVLRIGNGQREQELRFAWEGGEWVVAGVAMFQVVQGGKAAWMWTVRHEKFHRVGGFTLPAKTVIRRPTPKGDETLTIRYVDQKPNPPALMTQSGGDGGGDDGGGDDAGPDTWDDDGGGWDDEGWEDEDEAGNVPDGVDPPEGSGPAPTPAGRGPIPPVFQVDGTGLTDRGDLCGGGGS